jgi:hypothetical protein
MTGFWFLVYLASLVLVIWAIVDIVRRPAGALPPARKVVWIASLVAGCLFSDSLERSLRSSIWRDPASD